MKNKKRDTIKSPWVIFIIYMLVSFLLVMCFRFIFPGSVEPLPVFVREWRLLLGLLDYFNLFPALAFSALVIPFGITSYENLVKKSGAKFSPEHFKRLTAPVSVAIFAAIIYGLIFFLALPTVKNSKENMIFQRELYNLARERALFYSRAGQWLEASQFLDIADRVWPGSPGLATLRADIDAHFDEYRYYERLARIQARQALAAGGNWHGAALASLPGQIQPPDVTAAIAMGETAFEEGRYFDAHWLATLGERLAIPGSPEAATSVRLASRAWNEIISLAPSRQDQRRFALFEMKRSGYLAMVSGDWIQAFYIFSELITLTPDDRDVINFLAASQRGIEELAFFIDEMPFALGKILTGAVFSLPGPAGSREVLRFSGLSLLPDVAYGVGFEYIRFDVHSSPLVSLYAPYVKLLPFNVDGRQQVMVQMRALDRFDESRYWGPQWFIGHETNPRLILDISYEDFVLLSSVRYGLSNLQVNELLAVSRILDGNAGYVPEVFQAEILNRFGAMFFLPMAIFVIMLGWRFRPKGKQRYFFVLLFPVLPVVFYWVVLLYRFILNNLGILLTISVGFTAAAVVFAILFCASFLGSLIMLAAQRD